MNLRRHDERSIRRAQRFKHNLPIARDGIGVIVHMRTAIQRGERAFAHAAITAGKRNAHARLNEEFLISKRPQRAMRPQRERIELWQGKLLADRHGVYTRRRRNSGM